MEETQNNALGNLELSDKLETHMPAKEAQFFLIKTHIPSFLNRRQSQHVPFSGFSPTFPPYHQIKN
jgi:hypothetical protein